MYVLRTSSALNFPTITKLIYMFFRDPANARVRSNENVCPRRTRTYISPSGCMKIILIMSARLNLHRLVDGTRLLKAEYLKGHARVSCRGDKVKVDRPFGI